MAEVGQCSGKALRGCFCPSCRETRPVLAARRRLPHRPATTTPVPQSHQLIEEAELGHR